MESYKLAKELIDRITCELEISTNNDKYNNALSDAKSALEALIRFW